MFHFVIPRIWKFFSPAKVFKSGVEWWFKAIARCLRLSSFLIGGEFPEEEIDVETIPEPSQINVRYGTLNPGAKLRRSERLKNIGRSTPDASDWEDVDGQSEGAAAKVSGNLEKHLLQYLRVPNHDHIEVIPGSKVVVRMGYDDPVFGREGETVEEIASNWTKVYAPFQFSERVFQRDLGIHFSCAAMAYHHWISGIICLAAINDWAPVF